MSGRASRRIPLVIDPDDCGPLFDELYDDEHEEWDNRGAFERLGNGVKRRKPAIPDD